ncbi:SDR family oxidoreductase [Frankia sp. CNm7]|uniref:SDR family oxidoreductase n=1 Tax=Frankia nepalensis TaxID=1836974 RepID=A0A937RM97_9ACTN|nr:SDR family oxidoreductase [Frankia nepalensis]MBL7500174.1 SDR family oxidoreductase [Frankia nepalensis]MBL7512406.1 SDR family oxidoreductase [Frankia nepalensis]MBL7518530.1 SDR family oxidoreductase [Frankia nepalensis]MBL7632722.1 SDR family oxidoreductase [Frankia nepalensis]
MPNEVLVVIGTGGMGVAVARRVGAGRTVLLADYDEAALSAVTETLREEGQQVTPQVVDVSSRDSVYALARAAQALGPVRHVVHTAGVSPTQAPTEAILKVDLLGTALVLDAFAEVIAPGGAGVIISSMSSYLAPPPAREVEAQLANTATEDLLNLPFTAPDAFGSAGYAYSFAKRANWLRVRAASVAWGARGARVNSISPGVISTKMGQQELASESGAGMRAMVAASGTGRLGSPDDIAAAAQFLLSDAASFITGIDLLVDGGAVAAVSTGRVDLAAARS